MVPPSYTPIVTQPLCNKDKQLSSIGGAIQIHFYGNLFYFVLHQCNATQWPCFYDKLPWFFSLKVEDLIS